MKTLRTWVMGTIIGGMAASLMGSCALSVAPTSSTEHELSLQLAAFPDRVSVVDSTASAEIWATLRRGKDPVRDSTIVFFATTVGKITSTGLTRDGLAVVTLTSPGDGRPRRAEVVAQALTVRDTLSVDFVLFEE